MNFFPDPQKQGEIKFWFAKGLPYQQRIWFILAFLVTGLLVQLFVNFWLGLLFLAAGTSLSLVKGYDSTPELKRGETWDRVTPDEYEKVLRRQKELKRWDRDLFDITNPLGAGVVIFLVIVFVILYVLSEVGRYNDLFSFLLWDSVVLFVPQWLSGTKSYLKRDRLMIKIRLLQMILRRLGAPSDIQVQPMLSTQEAGKGGRVPKDARLLIRLLNAPEDFLGVQVQIAINSVQGTDYPYLYCVILARGRAKLFSRGYPSLEDKLLRNVVTKLTKADDVDVLVVRQKTTKNSGYHTNPWQAQKIVSLSLDLARDFIK